MEYCENRMRLASLIDKCFTSDKKPFCNYNKMLSLLCKGRLFLKLNRKPSIATNNIAIMRRTSRSQCAQENGTIHLPTKIEWNYVPGLRGERNIISQTSTDVVGHVFHSTWPTYKRFICWRQRATIARLRKSQQLRLSPGNCDRRISHAQSFREHRIVFYYIYSLINTWRRSDPWPSQRLYIQIFIAVWVWPSKDFN